uniref:Uncharacterized protein n=1 Tax=Toxoplasma gondii COUG TaxID=1074873 RepID=A0A2G8Y6V0_TOXGO|nr:hypothetical protein TGCOUG_392380 [Toxoplasma gondii COUG]
MQPQDTKGVSQFDFLSAPGKDEFLFCSFFPSSVPTAFVQLSSVGADSTKKLRGYLAWVRVTRLSAGAARNSPLDENPSRGIAFGCAPELFSKQELFADFPRQLRECVAVADCPLRWGLCFRDFSFFEVRRMMSQRETTHFLWRNGAWERTFCRQQRPSGCMYSSAGQPLGR